MITTKDHILNFLFKRPQHFFPLLIFSLLIFFFAKFVLTKNLWFLAAFIFSPYLLPLITQRIVLGLYPIEEGGSYRRAENQQDEQNRKRKFGSHHSTPQIYQQ